MAGDLPKAAQETKGCVLICFHLCARIFGRAAQCVLGFDKGLINAMFLMDNWLLAFLLPKDGLIYSILGLYAGETFDQCHELEKKLNKN